MNAVNAQIVLDAGTIKGSRASNETPGVREETEQISNGEPLAPGEVAAMMRRAGLKVLAERGDDIATGIANKAAQGSVQCARFLHEFAIEEEKRALARRSRRSLAMEWTNEPEWTDGDEQALLAERSQERLTDH